jgi:AraC-like DNA-binding protein
MEQADPLASVLDMLRVRGAVLANVRAFAPWGFQLPQTPGAVFHAVTGGSCWLRVPGEEPRELRRGDVVLLPSGASHTMASDRGGPAELWEHAAKARALDDRCDVVFDGVGDATELVCATYEYDRDVASPLLSLLPRALFVAGPDASDEGAVQMTLRLVRQELEARGPGWRTSVDRLFDVLFVHVLRAWAEAQSDGGASCLLALRDPVIARALAAMHGDPAAPWTTARLAREVNLSRATLIRRFTALVGEPPLAYLSRWRMDLAARDLRLTGDPVSVIARRVGYESEFAFSRAFSRWRGKAPGRYRAEFRRS